MDSCNEGGGGGGGGGGNAFAQSIEEVMDAAKIYEDTGSFSRAIDTYLSIKDNYTAPGDKLVEVWENAVRVAGRFSQDRYNEVVDIVANRLKTIKKYEAAGELYEGADQPREAVNCYVAGEIW